MLVADGAIATITEMVFRKERKKTKLPKLAAELLARFFSVLLYALVVLLAVGVRGDFR